MYRTLGRLYLGTLILSQKLATLNKYDSTTWEAFLLLGNTCKSRDHYDIERAVRTSLSFLE